jgi:hypothetical protein
MMRLRALHYASACAAALACAACSSTNSDGSVNQAHPLLGTKSLQLTSAFALRPEAVVIGAALLIVVDPLAPNWKIEQSEPSPGEFHLALKMKRFTNEGGGDGEARLVFQRRASALARERGADPWEGYTIMEFSEGIESTLPFAQRVAHGVVRIAAAPVAAK